MGDLFYDPSDLNHPQNIRMTAFCNAVELLPRLVWQYQLWDRAGQPSGREEEFWYDAERELEELRAG